MKDTKQLNRYEQVRQSLLYKKKICLVGRVVKKLSSKRDQGEEVKTKIIMYPALRQV